MNNQDSPNGGSYRAAQGNLNTVISNPSVNINDTMNMNIQNMNSTSNNNSILISDLKIRTTSPSIITRTSTRISVINRIWLIRN